MHIAFLTGTCPRMAITDDRVLVEDPDYLVLGLVATPNAMRDLAQRYINQLGSAVRKLYITDTLQRSGMLLYIAFAYLDRNENRCTFYIYCASDTARITKEGEYYG